MVGQLYWCVMPAKTAVASVVKVEDVETKAKEKTEKAVEAAQLKREVPKQKQAAQQVKWLKKDLSKVNEQVYHECDPKEVDEKLRQRLRKELDVV